MQFTLLTVEDVHYLHDQVINEGELAGLAVDKSLEAAIARVENRLNYGLIEDVCDLAATYAVVLAIGHVFNEANKRTAFAAMNICLVHNGIEPAFDFIDAANMIIKTAQGIVDEKELAQWLCNHL